MDQKKQETLLDEVVILSWQVSSNSSTSDRQMEGHIQISIWGSGLSIFTHSTVNIHMHDTLPGYPHCSGR